MMKKVRAYAELVKFEHTIFALPFALASVLILAKEFPSLWKLFWILVALVSARTVGMAFNRLIDEPYDRLNPRTKNWPLVRGEVSKEEVRRIILVGSFVFIFSSFMLNFLAFLLSPVVLLLLWFYPQAKRITYYPHLVLGIVYFLIPVAVDVALNERISLTAVILGVAMAFWVAGFDVLYALQDYEFDKEVGLKSIPVKYGIENAIKIAKLFHFITFLSLLILGFTHRELGFIYFLGLFLIALFLVYEHSLIKPWDLSKINKAFFTVNGWISVLFFFIVLIDYYF
ncbi:MAG: 4-hydroxybenzoate octaprenyltransferase [Aquifex sp.]|nr:MAG: 4-hydroxybenzoate octaprenyltransferase [Aquifex sp.]